MQFSKKSCFIVLLCFLMILSTLLPSSLVEASGVGQFTTFLPKDPQNYFNNPYGVAVDKDGNVYVADTYNNRIQKFTSDGTFQKTWGSYGMNDGEFYYPTGIAVDAAGNVYVADYYNHRIQKFSSNGTFEKAWGSYGNTDGKFQNPFGIAVDAAGNVYVADYGNNRIQKFTSDGTFLNKWGSAGTNDGEFYSSTGIVVDAAGNVYVTDYNSHRIQKFTSDGVFLSKWGSLGTNDSQFNGPTGMAVDAEGNVYVTDTFNNRIQKLLVQQPVSSNVELSSLTVSEGTLSPPFSTTQDTFTLDVDNATSNLTVTATAVDSHAKVEILGMTSALGTVTHTVGLTVGSNVIPVMVTAQDGVTTKTYTITVTRAGSSDTTLKSLTVSEGTLSPAFASNTDDYTVIVDDSVTSLNVTAIPMDQNANVTINGNVTTSDTITLTVGQPTSIPIVVTGQDGVTTKTYTITVTVQTANIPVTSVTLNQSNLHLTAGGSRATLIATVNPTNATNRNVTWSSDNPTVASVDSNGVVTPISAGTATITVTTVDGGKLATSLVTVQPASVVIPVTSVTLNQSNLHLSAGGSSATLIATVNPTNATNQNVTWSSDNPTVASVDSNGVITPISAGTATITVTTVDGGKLATSLVWVQENSSGGGGWISSPIPTPTAEKLPVQIEGENGSILTKTSLERRRETNGVIKDRLELLNSIAREVVAKAKEQDIHTVRFIMPNLAEKATETWMDIPKTALSEMMNGNLNIEIVTENGVIAIPVTSLESWKDDLYFRIVPVKKEEGKHAIETRAKQNEQVKEMLKAGNGMIEILGLPMTIETNMQNLPVTVTLPLSANVSAEQIDNLVIYIEHSDGTKEAVRGRIIQINSATKGIAFDVNHFSTFSMLYVEGAEEYYASLENDPVPEEKTTGTHLPYIQGYSDGTFRPNAIVTRAQTAAMLARNLSENDVPVTSKLTYKDTNKLWAKNEIDFVRAQGIMKGLTEHTFGPNDSITRAQMAVIAVRWIDKQCAENPESMSLCELKKRLISYSDVETTYWAAKEIERIGQFGVMEGSGDGQFHPNDKLTRAQAVKVLNRLFQRGPFENDSTPVFKDVSTQHWAFKEIQEATLRHTYEIQDGIEYRQQ